MKHIYTSSARALILMLLVGTISVAGLACGSDAKDDDSSSGGPIAKINSTDRIFATDDITSVADFKLDDEYDIEGLDSAVSAIYGFYGEDPYNRLEYEIRFYPDHATATGIGVDFADEATGADAVVLKDVQRWDEGLKDRRQCAGNGGHHSGKCDNPKYFSYVVVGNMIVMCQGKDALTSLQACADLMSAVQ